VFIPTDLPLEVTDISQVSGFEDGSVVFLPRVINSADIQKALSNSGSAITNFVLTHNIICSGFETKDTELKLSLDKKQGFIGSKISDYSKTLDNTTSKTNMFLLWREYCHT
jgi:hypothetical protein